MASRSERTQSGHRRIGERGPWRTRRGGRGRRGARARWNEAERALEEVGEELRVIMARANHDLGATASQVAEELQEAYRQLRQALESR